MSSEPQAPQEQMRSAGPAEQQHESRTWTAGIDVLRSYPYQDTQWHLHAIEFHRRYLEMVLTAVYEDEIKPLRKALESIAANTCCDRCQEAALVAKTALSFSRQAGSAND